MWTKTTVRAALLVLAFALVAPALLVGHRGEATQQRRSQVVTPHEFNWRDSAPRWPLPPGEEALGRIDGDHLKQLVTEYAGISLKDRDSGNPYWGRISGSKADAWAREWTMAKLKAAGVQDVEDVPMDLVPQWRPVSWEVQAKGPRGTTKLVSAQPATGALSTPAAGISPQAIWLGLGCPADFNGRDVRGKAVVLFVYMYGFSAQSCGGDATAAKNGAAAIFIVNNQPGNLRVQTRVRVPDLKIPVFSLGKDDGETLRQMIERGPTQMHIKLETKMVSGLKTGNIFGTLPGQSQEDIVILAHRDGYFQGAGDNASGMAVMIGLAEYFARVPEAQRPRTIRFLASTGHHQQGLSGPATLTQEPLRERYFGNTVFLFNVEHVAWTETSNHSMGVPKPIMRGTTGQDARRWFVNGTPRLATLFLDTMREFGIPLYDAQDLGNPGEGRPFTDLCANIGIISSPPRMHTQADVPDLVPAAGLEQVARAIAKIVIEVGKMDQNDLRQAKVTYTQN